MRRSLSLVSRGAPGRTVRVAVVAGLALLPLSLVAFQSGSRSSLPPGSGVAIPFEGAGWQDKVLTHDGYVVPPRDLADAVLAHQIFLLGALEDSGTIAPRGCDLLTGGVPCYGVYPTHDGRFVAVGALEAKFWRALCEALGRPDLVPLQFATGAEGERVRGELEAIFATATLAQWRERLEHADCCVTPVLTFAEALADPQFAARGMVLRSDDGTRQYAPPFRLSPPSFAVAREAPRHGEHTEEVLREAGFDAGAIDALVRERAVSRAS